MSRIVPDTGILIEIFIDEEVSDAVAARRFRWRHSAVVHSELLRGLRSPGEQRYVRSLERTFPPIPPATEHWIRCGEILSRLARDHGFNAAGMRNIQNDVLIALTAHSLGAPVLTTNIDDFELIQKHLRGLEIIAFPFSSFPVEPA